MEQSHIVLHLGSFGTFFTPETELRLFETALVLSLELDLFKLEALYKNLQSQH